jgi:hypothetical protein
MKKALQYTRETRYVVSFYDEMKPRMKLLNDCGGKWISILVFQDSSASVLSVSSDYAPVADGSSSSSE